VFALGWEQYGRGIVGLREGRLHGSSSSFI
jgi:hypothetical protein